ncbi:MAG: hypothetical protein KC635_10530 [Myxococcales bacterium]|nr:hypothetical protein [Myxococcales bacterium]MCB9731330.1 hypothetical protein [Deltaproteobacteria bacterium]
MLRRVLALVVPALLVAACSIPEGGQGAPTAAYYRLIQVRAAGDTDQLWELLDPEVRRSFRRWHLAEKIAVNEIRTNYPEADKAEALKAMGDGKRADLPDEKALFVSLSHLAAPEQLESLSAFSARVRSEELASDGVHATIRTWGGDEVPFVKSADDGQWYATLPSAELERLKNFVDRAELNLRRVRANLEKLSRK